MYDVPMDLYIKLDISFKIAAYRVATQPAVGQCA